MESRLQSVKCFIGQEAYLPLEEYKHKVHLVVIYDTYFAVVFRKIVHGNKLLAVRIPYLSTCSQMRTQYYEVLEPSTHEATRDGVVFWTGPVEEVPEWRGRLQQVVTELAAQAWKPGPVGAKGVVVWDSAGNGNTLIKLQE